MRPWARWAILTVAAAGIALLFVVLRPEPAGDDGSPTPTAPTSPPPTTSPSGSPSPSPEPQAVVIEVTVRGGEVDGPSRPRARQGEEVLIVVRADVSDHVHVHGYDLMEDVAPGRPARIRFTAEAAGVFEVELEDAGRLLFQLEIVP